MHKLNRRIEVRQLRTWPEALRSHEAQFIVRTLVSGMDCPSCMDALEGGRVLSHPHALRRPFRVEDIVRDITRVPSNHVVFLQVFQSDETPLQTMREPMMVSHPSANFAAHLSVWKGDDDEYALIEAGNFNSAGKTNLRVNIMSSADLMHVLDAHSRAKSGGGLIDLRRAEVLWDVQAAAEAPDRASIPPVTVQHPAAIFPDRILFQNGWTRAHITALRAGMLG